MFGEVILVPELNREPQFDSSSPDIAQHYEFDCLCGYKINLNLPSYIGDYLDHEDVLGPENAEVARDHFGLRKDRSLVSGWPKLRIESCPKCAERFLVYVSVFEPANGWYKIVPQGITQLLPSNNRMQSDAAKLRR